MLLSFSFDSFTQIFLIQQNISSQERILLYRWLCSVTAIRNQLSLLFLIYSYLLHSEQLPTNHWNKKYSKHIHKQRNARINMNIEKERFCYFFFQFQLCSRRNNHVSPRSGPNAGRAHWNMIYRFLQTYFKGNRWKKHLNT